MEKKYSSEGQNNNIKQFWQLVAIRVTSASAAHLLNRTRNLFSGETISTKSKPKNACKNHY